MNHLVLLGNSKDQMQALLAWKDRLVQDLRQDIDQVLQRPDALEVSTLVALAHEGLRACDEIAAQQRPQPVSCGVGCAACCRYHNAVTLPELLLLWTSLDTEADPQLAADIEARAAAIAGTSNNRRTMQQIPCGLLDEQTGLCRAYGQRPGTCRGQSSLDAPALCGPPPGQVHRYAAVQWSVYAAFWEALEAGLVARGLDCPAIELTLGLDLLRRDPTVIERWRRGEQGVFAGVAVSRDGMRRAGVKRSGER